MAECMGLLKNFPTRLLPYTHEAEPQMYGYYRGWLYNVNAFSLRIRRQRSIHRAYEVASASRP